MARKKRKKKNSSGTKVLIGILVILIMLAGGVMGYKIVKDKENESESVSNEGDNVITAGIEEKNVKIFKGNDRPFAVMIDNHKDAWPQAGLQKAYMVYEIIVEGGETRLMALFKGANVDKIGPVRSARHYFIDYAMENDAIYTHFGESPQADNDIKKYSVNEIDGIAEDGTTFSRVKDKASPHNAVTNIEKLLKSAKNKKYRTTSNEKSVLNYVTDEVNLEDSLEAVSVTIPHSDLQTVKYLYDEENKVYERYARGKEQSDWTTKEPITTKNIIITFCDNYTLTDKENKGRQGLKNIGTFDGYYITNGKAIKIKCIKNARDEKTKYQDLEGNDIKVNDGNTFVNICPTNAKVVLEWCILGQGKNTLAYRILIYQDVFWHRPQIHQERKEVIFMQVYDTANRLAQEIKQSEEYVNYKMAKQALNLNSSLKEKMAQFEQKRYETQLMAMQTGKQDEEKMTEMQNLYAELIEIDEAKKFFDAETKFNIMIADVNKIIGEAIRDVI